MASQAVKTLGLFKKFTKLDKGIGTQLPEGYKKFYKEWKFMQPAPVHYIPKEGKWKRDELTGIVQPVQNVPIPLKFPLEYDEHMWGGEGIIQGFQKRSKFKRRVPHFWFPTLQRSVVYSEVLDKHISVIVTDRTIQLINDNYGFDHYLLKTLACDLKSLLALGLKRKILQELIKRCPAYNNTPDKQQDIYNRYKEYLKAYTSEEIEWYGYSFEEACKKYEKLQEQVAIPLKQIYRTQLIEDLKTAQTNSYNEENLGTSSSWIKKINPFGKRQES